MTKTKTNTNTNTEGKKKNEGTDKAIRKQENTNQKT